MEYRELGLQTYGRHCELCGNARVEVHHIDYQIHQLFENRLRRAKKNQMDITLLLEEAKKAGFLEWDGHELQKNHSSTNLSVLCCNCHTLVHLMDVGLNVLNALEKRR